MLRRKGARAGLFMVCLLISGCATVELIGGAVRSSVALASPAHAAAEILEYLADDTEAINALLMVDGPIETASWVVKILYRHRGAVMSEIPERDREAIDRFKVSMLSAHVIVLEYSARTGKPIPDALRIVWARAEQVMDMIERAKQEHRDGPPVQVMLDTISPWEQVGAQAVGAP